MEINYKIVPNELETEHLEKVIEIYNRINDSYMEIENCNKELKEIQDNCIHEFKLNYENKNKKHYSCIHCDFGAPVEYLNVEPLNN